MCIEWCFPKETRNSIRHILKSKQIKICGIIQYNNSIYIMCVILFRFEGFLELKSVEEMCHHHR